MKSFLLFVLFVLSFSVLFAQTECTVKIVFATNKSLPPSYSFKTDPQTEGAKYYWSFSDNTVSDNPTPTHSFKASGSYKITVKVSTPDGKVCSGSLQETFEGGTVTTTSTDCKAYFTAAKASETAVKKFTFTNYSTGQLRECLWSFGDNTSSTATATTVTHEYANTGEYKVCLTIATVAGCKADYCTTVKVGTTTSTTTTPTITDCKAYFTAAKASETAVKKFTFTNYSTGQLRECLWSFGDNTSSTATATTVTHEYANNGEYKVCLTIATVAGCKADFCTTVKVGTTTSTTTTPTITDCKAYFTAAKASETAVKKFTFTNYSTGQLRECLWSFGDNTSSTATATTVTHEYANTGEYKVCLTIATVAGCKSYYCSSIKVGTGTSTTTSTGCKFDLVIKPKEGTTNTFLFYAVSSFDINTWKWNFGDGITNDTKNPQHTYEKTGTYEVKCVITNALGCTESRTVKYSVLDQSLSGCKGAVSLLLFDPTDNLCNGKAAIKLLNESASEVPNVKYVWSDGQTGSSVGNLCADKPYSVQAILEGVCQKSTSFTLLSKPLWRASAFNGINTFSVVEPKDGIDYKWNFGDGAVVDGAEVNYNFEKDGVYNVTLSAVSGSSISESTQQIIVMKNATGIDILNKNDLKIYPNPVTDVLNINLGNPVEKDLLIEIYSASGQKVSIRQLGNTTYSLVPIDVHALKQGLYFVKISDETQVIYQQKFIKLVN